MKQLILLISCLSLSACTAVVWEDFKPNTYFEVSMPSQDVEKYLKKSGRKYYCKISKTKYGKPKKRCFAKTSYIKDLEVFSINVLQTPVAIVADTVMVGVATITVVGYVVLAAMGGDTGPDKPNEP